MSTLHMFQLFHHKRDLKKKTISGAKLKRKSQRRPKMSYGQRIGLQDWPNIIHPRFIGKFLASPHKGLRIAPGDLDANNEYLLVIFNALWLLRLVAEHFPSPERSFTIAFSSFCPPSISYFSENSGELKHSSICIANTILPGICIQMHKAT